MKELEAKTGKKVITELNAKTLLKSKEETKNWVQKKGRINEQ